jgi:hypothetical protein
MKTTTALLKLLGLMAFVVVFNASCKKNDKIDTTNPNNTTGPFTVTLPNNAVNMSVAGKVVDDNNNPVSNATVTGGGITVTTDANGVYRINHGNFNGNYATIKIEKANYFTLVKTIRSRSGNTQYIVSKLSPKTLIGTIAVSGGSVQFGSGNITLEFPANAFVDAAGAAVTGSVNIYATYIDPTTAEATTRMPGNLTAAEAPSTEYLLQSYGMIGVELKDANGLTVKLAAGKKAAITASIPASLVASAPDSLPLWYFDENAGVWVKEGTATKAGNTYKGEVAHFTFWNMDTYCSWYFFESRFINRNDSSIIAYGHFSINGVGSSTVYHETTDADGTTLGMVPQNTALRLRFYDANGIVVLDSLIGPYTNSVNIGDVYVNYPLTAPTISGTMVDCSGQVVTHGSMSAMVDSLDYHADVSSDGTFSITLAPGLALNSQIYITGIDSTTSIAVAPSTITYSGNHNMSTSFVFACASGGPSEFISYNLDGTDHIFVRNLDSAFCSRTYAFNRTNIACRRANGSPMVEGYVAFITGPTVHALDDTSSILTLHQYSSAGTPKTLNIDTFTESYSAYPSAQGVEGWVIGTFTCVYRDDASLPHTITSNFRMWRRN